MLAYATHRENHRSFKPSTLALILGGHAVVIGLVAAAKMDISILPPPITTDVYNVPLPPPPPELPKPQPKPRQLAEQPAPRQVIDHPMPPLPLPTTGPVVDYSPSISTTLPDIGPALETPLPGVKNDPPPVPVRLAARSITPADLIRPPYPESKRRTEQEATLQLRLTIDERGRVTAVEPVGTADPAFLASARSHLLRYWRYRPASEDGRAVVSHLVVTLRFELEE